ncbi:uncharacterized protein FOMMEDRAFT_155991 [Fomitiporia mediterranea MF3/22]|uniref:uncharacterized protein n=1 Tax=Fomitiporia mediterranea (strain MF3/22) TaxID=694068 RepID=UPI0004408606|nr:uncharacterized protein FOMMEDRAFT_155991 [Fomitiporia mediterranea MF3/22]EJD02662.1 hypothetical protein FOMMEDRAFT_155991 [Fomitiporia mediterranea MF3/22]
MFHYNNPPVRPEHAPASIPAYLPGVDLEGRPVTPPRPAIDLRSDPRAFHSPISINSHSLSAHITGEKQTHAKMGKTLFGEVLTGLIIDVPHLIEDKLSDKALGRGLGRWVHGAGSEKAKGFTTKVAKMVSHLKEGAILKKKGFYSQPAKRWHAWRTPRRAESIQRLQKEEEEEQTQAEPQLEQLVQAVQEPQPQLAEHPKENRASEQMKQPEPEQVLEHTKQSEQEEVPEQTEQPEQEKVLQQLQQTESGASLKEIPREGRKKKRSTGPSDEEDTANFFNAIGNNIREMHGISGLTFDARVFSARFRHCSPADAAVDCVRKPDLVVLERWAADAPDAMWRDIKALLEIKRSSAESARRDAYRELLNCVRMVFAAQMNRRFVMGATICGDIMTFYIFDRSGCLVSEAFDINTDVERVTRVVCGMLFVDEIRLGYDPTIFREKDGRIVVMFKGVKYVCAEDPLYVEKSVRGRGTGCFETLYLGEPAVIKDAWVDDSRRRLEHEILEKVKDVEGVVKVVDYEIVQVPNDDDELENDTTTRNRKRLTEKDYWRTKAKWSGFDLVETRTHRRIILQPCGGPLEGFANLSELLLAIKDVIKCVQDLLERKVLHRDISMRNIILAKADPKNPDSRMRAYLIDFDYALDLENLSQDVAKGARTGTLPFMAIEMLAEETANHVPHAYYHDLESIFYSLCWLCTSQEGPNNTERDRRSFDFNKSEVAKWTGIGMENPSLDDIRRCKAATIRDETEFIEKVLNQFAPYFDPIKPCVLTLRDVMINEGSNSGDPLARSRVKERIDFLEGCRRAGISISPMMLKGIPNSQREPSDVFNSLYDIIDSTLEGLVEPSLPPTCTPEAKTKARAEEEFKKEVKRMKFRRYMSIREMQEEREANLQVKESEAIEEAEEKERKKKKADVGEDEEEDNEGYETFEEPERQRPSFTTSEQIALAHLRMRATMSASQSSVPGLTYSGTSGSASGTRFGSTSGARLGSSSWSSSLMAAPEIGPPPSMESVGSKRAFDEGDESEHGQPLLKKARKVSVPKMKQLPRTKSKPSASKPTFLVPGLPASRSFSGSHHSLSFAGVPQSKEPLVPPPSGDSIIPSSMESTRSKRSLSESSDDDSLTSDSRKRMRSGDF